MESPIRLIATDFDGTLFAEFENPPVPTKLQELIGELQSKGVKWVINTGRDMSSLMETLGRASLTVEPDFLVLVEREIHVQRDSLYTAMEPWNSSCSRDHEQLFKTIRKDVPRLTEWISTRFHAQIYEDPYSPFCLIARSNAEADVIHAYLEDYCRTVPNLAVVRNDVYARFCHAGYNKGTALAELTTHLGLSSSCVLAVGDHLNDLPMLYRKYAGYLAAPANAVAVVKQQVLREGGYVSPWPQGLGVADAIYALLRRGASA